MKQILRLIEENVDGCGTDVSILLEINGEKELDTIRLKNKILDEKEQMEYPDSDTLFEIAIEWLEKQGYTVNNLVPTDITF